jgi:hypothetical protein
MISRIGPVPNIADSSGVCCPHDAHASRKPAILANADQITRAHWSRSRESRYREQPLPCHCRIREPRRAFLKLKGGVSETHRREEGTKSVPLWQHKRCARGSSGNVRHEHPVGHPLLDVPDHCRLDSRGLKIAAASVDDGVTRKGNLWPRKVGP